MASGALPPAFPAVRIDGELYWDGGILSNTPVEAVFDDNPRRNSLVFAVHIWNPERRRAGHHLAGAEPPEGHPVFQPRGDATSRDRSRSTGCAMSSPNWSSACPRPNARSNAVRELADYGCLTRMHVVRLLAPSIDGEDHTKDIDFSPSGIRARWEAGYDDTSRVLAQAPWEGEFDPIEGFILHEARAGTEVTSG